MSLIVAVFLLAVRVPDLVHADNSKCGEGTVWHAEKEQCIVDPCKSSTTVWSEELSMCNDTSSNSSAPAPLSSDENDDDNGLGTGWVCLIIGASLWTCCTFDFFVGQLKNELERIRPHHVILVWLAPIWVPSCAIVAIVFSPIWGPWRMGKCYDSLLRFNWLSLGGGNLCLTCGVDEDEDDDEWLIERVSDDDDDDDKRADEDENACTVGMGLNNFRSADKVDSGGRIFNLVRLRRRGKEIQKGEWSFYISAS